MERKVRKISNTDVLALGVKGLKFASFYVPDNYCSLTLINVW